MSSKQFIAAEEHLAKLGVTVQQALDFISTNVEQEQAEVLYITARVNGVTNKMLSEITNISTSVISEYFSEHTEFDSIKLDYTSMLINSDLGALETLVDFNNNTGALSNTSLREAVQPLLDSPSRYDITFDSPYPDIYPNDGIYDAEELGVGHLSDVSATNESKESLFYGSLINMFKALEESELNEIQSFPNDGNPEDFQMLLLNALSESPSSVIWTDEQLAELVTGEATDIIDKFWVNDFVGVLDHSFLGLATA